MYGTSDVAMVVLLTDKSVQVDSMSIDSRKLEQKLHEHLFHFYHSSCWRNSFSWNHLFHRRGGGVLKEGLTIFKYSSFESIFNSSPI